MNKSIAIVVVLATLTGCATTREVWNKPGGNRQEFNMDIGQCRAQSLSIPFASLMQSAMVFNACMQGKGWELTRQPI